MRKEVPEMTRVLITTQPMAGHIRPGLALARELVAAGHDVVWYTGRKYRSLVAATGARFVPYAEHLDWDDADLLNGDGHGDAKPGLRALERSIIEVFIDPLPSHAADLEPLFDSFQPDVVVAEQGFMAGPAVAEQRGIPRVVFTVSPLSLSSVDVAPSGMGLAPASSAAGRLRNRTLNWLFRTVLLARAQRAALRARAAMGLPEIDGYFGDWVLQMSDRMLHTSIPELEYPRRDLPAKVEFIGALLAGGVDDWTPPAWWGDIEQARRAGRPIVVVTQGTLVTNPDNLLRPAIAGLATDDVLVVATTVGPDPASVVPVADRPANLRIERFIPFTELLPLADVMVTNGGFGGVQTALAHGVPVVGAGTTEDKAEVNGRVAWAGAGVSLRTDTPNAEQIRSAVRAVVTNPAYRAGALRLRAAYARYRGPARAAEVVLEAAREAVALS
jgi:MGT family glycosyltransferase